MPTARVLWALVFTSLSANKGMLQGHSMRSPRALSPAPQYLLRGEDRHVEAHAGRAVLGRPGRRLC